MPDLRVEGVKAIVERLGLADALRFLRQYEPGEGDYTRGVPILTPRIAGIVGTTHAATTWQERIAK